MKTILTFLAVIGLLITLLASWITHVVWWVKLLMAGELDTVGEGVLTILGTIIPFIGSIHGFILWFA